MKIFLLSMITVFTLWQCQGRKYDISEKDVSLFEIDIVTENPITLVECLPSCETSSTCEYIGFKNFNTDSKLVHCYHFGIETGPVSETNQLLETLVMQFIRVKVRVQSY